MKWIYIICFIFLNNNFKGCKKKVNIGNFCFVWIMLYVIVLESFGVDMSCMLIN